MIWHWLEGKREDLAPFSSPRGNLPAREAGDLLHHGTSRVSSIYKSRPTSSPICGRSHYSSATSSCDDLWTHQRCCCSCSWARRSGHPPAPSSRCSWKHSCGDAGAERDACNDDEEGRRCTATARPRPCAISCSAECAGKCQNSSEPWCHGWRPAGGRGIAYKVFTLYSY